MTKKESIIILFSITLCWSSSYVFIKDIPQNFSVYAYLALTSGVAGIILAFVMRRKLKLLNSVSLRQGLILGALITASNMFENWGWTGSRRLRQVFMRPWGSSSCRSS